MTIVNEPEDRRHLYKEIFVHTELGSNRMKISSPIIRVMNKMKREGKMLHPPVGLIIYLRTNGERLTGIVTKPNHIMEGSISIRNKTYRFPTLIQALNFKCDLQHENVVWNNHGSKSTTSTPS